jgi:hypothetical protein
MLTRRELASIVWYSALFSAVVGWAVLRRGPFAGPASSIVEADSDPHLELHRIVHRVAGQ